MLAKNIAVAGALYHENEILTLITSYILIFRLTLAISDVFRMIKWQLKFERIRRTVESETAIERRDNNQLLLPVQCTHFGALRQMALLVIKSTPNKAILLKI